MKVAQRTDKNRQEQKPKRQRISRISGVVTRNMVVPRVQRMSMQ